MYINKRIIKNLISDYKSRTSKPRAIIRELPKNVLLEPINYCNLRCPVYSTSRIGKDIQRLMTLDEYKMIINQIPAGTNVSLYLYGESFLHPDIFEMISLAKKQNLNVYMHSNLNLENSVIQKIAKSGIDLISASIDGASKETYEKFRKKGNYELAWSNFLELDRLKAELNANFTLVWQFIVNKNNEHEMDKAVEMLKSMKSSPRISFIPMGFREEMPDYYQFNKEQLNILYERWLPENKEYLNPYIKNNCNPPVVDNTICNFLFDTTLITANGDVLPCCFTYQKKHSFGNAFETPLLEIWNNKAYQTSRKFFFDKEFKGCNTICANCDNFIRIETKNVFIRNYHFLIWLLKKIKMKSKEIATG
ncbi:MAG TPA: radical SAM protein [Candidatus Kapabacteria bacterium]|nr:radical SAM protein [Candidatus Kapabacteria bacterium]HPO62321.1 radical SAM protein [Candidatus Kapabacteria bacterium]